MFKTFQAVIVEQEPRLESACVPINKSHLTLMVFHAKDEQLRFGGKVKLN
jgi:hypothetical protein